MCCTAADIEVSYRAVELPLVWIGYSGNSSVSPSQPVRPVTQRRSEIPANSARVHRFVSNAFEVAARSMPMVTPLRVAESGQDSPDRMGDIRLVNTDKRAGEQLLLLRAFLACPTAPVAARFPI